MPPSGQSTLGSGRNIVPRFTGTALTFGLIAISSMKWLSMPPELSSRRRWGFTLSTGVRDRRMDGPAVAWVQTLKGRKPWIRRSIRDLEIQFPNPSDKKVWSVSDLQIHSVKSIRYLHDCLFQKGSVLVWFSLSFGFGFGPSFGWLSLSLLLGCSPFVN